MIRHPSILAGEQPDAARITAVADIDDPRLAPYRAVRDRDLATLAGGDGHPGRFVAEGEVVLRSLLSRRSRFEPDSVLVAEEKAGRLGDLLAEAPTGMPVYAAPRHVMDAIVGFPVHRGLLGIGRRRDPDVAGDILPAMPAASLVLGLVGLANHDNVGAAFRNAAAFAADAILLDAGSCDPLYRKAIRVSVGACLTVPFRRAGTAADLVGTLESAGYTIVALSPSGRERVDAVAWPRRTALLVGAEGAGLPPALLASRRSVRIDMPGGVDSLNVATAAGIALHAARVDMTGVRRR